MQIYSGPAEFSTMVYTNERCGELEKQRNWISFVPLCNIIMKEYTPSILSLMGCV